MLATKKIQQSINVAGNELLVLLNEDFILTLVRLRLGLLTNLLSDLFGISTASVSKTFRAWICFLGKILKYTLLIWPSKQQISSNLPKSFKKFPSVRIIIYCTEIYIEKPTTPSAQRATWSNYSCGLGIQARGISHNKVVWWTCWNQGTQSWQTKALI